MKMTSLSERRSIEEEQHQQQASERRETLDENVYRHLQSLYLSSAGILARSAKTITAVQVSSTKHSYSNSSSNGSRKQKASLSACRDKHDKASLAR